MADESQKEQNPPAAEKLKGPTHYRTKSHIDVVRTVKGAKVTKTVPPETVVPVTTFSDDEVTSLVAQQAIEPIHVAAPDVVE